MTSGLASARSAQQSATSIPRRVTVSEVLQSRYAAGTRPTSWDNRMAGHDCVKTADGETILLASSGGQSTPAAGWQLLLTEAVPVETGESAYRWTLYGVSAPHRAHE